MKLKIFGTGFWFNKDSKQCRAVIAAMTKKAAAKAFNQSMYIFNNYSCETGNKKEIYLALKNQGLLLK